VKLDTWCSIDRAQGTSVRSSPYRPPRYMYLVRWWRRAPEEGQQTKPASASSNWVKPVHAAGSFPYSIGYARENGIGGRAAPQNGDETILVPSPIYR